MAQTIKKLTMYNDTKGKLCMLLLLFLSVGFLTGEDVNESDLPIEYQGVLSVEELGQVYGREKIRSEGYLWKYIDVEMTEENKNKFKEYCIGKSWQENTVRHEIWLYAKLFFQVNTKYVKETVCKGRVCVYALPRATFFIYEKVLAISDQGTVFAEVQDVIIYEHGIDWLNNEKHYKSPKSGIITDDETYQYVFLRNKEEQESSQWSCRLQIHKKSGKMELIRFTDEQSDYSKIKYNEVPIRDSAEVRTGEYLNMGDKVRIIDRSYPNEFSFIKTVTVKRIIDNKEVIEKVDYFRYKVELPDGKIAWVDALAVNIQ